MHQLSKMDEPDQVFAPGGALEALIQAKKSGKVRFIGFHPVIPIRKSISESLELADQHGLLFHWVLMSTECLIPCSLKQFWRMERFPFWRKKISGFSG